MLKNKVALVTGAASGIGKAISQAFAEQGAKVIIADIELSRATTVANNFKTLGYDVMALEMDVSNEKSVESATARAIDHYGGIDILVSNAGIPLDISPIENLAFSAWKNMLDIQLNGAFLTTRACLRDMYKRNQGGSIIYIGSVHSKDASIQRFKSAYVTAKHGLLGLCRVVAKEGAEHGVRANVICPAFVKTPLVDVQIPEQAKAFGVSEEDLIKKIWLKDTVDGEFTTLKEVANVAVFFADFESNALTGQSLFVTHGWSMQ